jgi:thioredoxin 1
MERITLNSVDQLNALTAARSNVLIIVSRSNCPGCDALERTLEHHAELRTALADTVVGIAKVEHMPNITQVFALRQAPSMILFKDDDEVARITGFQAPHPLIQALHQAFRPMAEAA